MNRLLDYPSSVIKKLSKQEIIEAIANSEGRVMMAETIGTIQPLLNDISNAEFVASMGVELINLNVFDVKRPVINGLPKQNEQIKQLIDLTGCLIGINLEPVNFGLEKDKDNIWEVTSGRLATVENVLEASKMGIKFITLTGNPGVNVDNKTICQSLRNITSVFKDELIFIAGKMHGAGVNHETGSGIITHDDIDSFVDNGADIIMVPACGTIPTMTVERVGDLISHIHKRGKLALTAIGTSQEGADVNTIRQIALMNKMAGSDIHHIGDSGYLGMALPENIHAYSLAIRGVRHTYRRMAMSIKR
ncbi:MAG: haloacid dehalogenase-like hydrolase [Erysipelotrichaceae bacterium]|nr:haloacid dehalogenase-like hydrolase [Erysipelotrichaceae bacterium]